jgi:hypothetical protein
MRTTRGMRNTRNRKGQNKMENKDLSEEDQAFLKKYGRLPPTKQILSSRLKVFIKLNT